MLKAQAIGNLGQDAKIKEVNGKVAIQFSVAINEAFYNKDNVKVEKTTWLNLTYWRENANKSKVAEYLKKGTQVHVEFKPDVNCYQGQDGKHYASFNGNVTSLTLLGSSNKETEKQQSGGMPDYTPPVNTSPDNDDLPF